VQEQFVVGPIMNSQGREWLAALTLTNDGPGTAQHVACSFLAANARMLVGAPELASTTDAGATLSVQSTPSTASVAVKDFSPRAVMTIQFQITVPSDLADDIRHTLASAEGVEKLPQKLVASGGCQGENIRVVDSEFTPMPHF
jgi:hypothetical protein